MAAVGGAGVEVGFTGATAPGAAGGAGVTGASGAGGVPPVVTGWATGLMSVPIFPLVSNNS